MRALTIISGVFLIFVSVFCFANPGETFLSLAFFIGIIMVASSLIQIAAYLRVRLGEQENKHAWIMSEALITFILGVLVLSNLIVADAATPLVFGLWIMFSGILRVVIATHINRKEKRSNFWWTMISGTICTLSGIYVFVNPIVADLAIAILLGILFLLQGACVLELGIHMPHEKESNDD